MYACEPANCKILKFSGADKEDFLHRLTTQDFKQNFKKNMSSKGAFLTEKGGLRALFFSYMDENDIKLLVKDGVIEEVFHFLEKMHFGEDVEWEEQKTLFSYEYLGQISPIEGLYPYEYKALGVKGGCFFSDSEELKSQFLERIKERDFKKLTGEEFLIEQAKMGIPREGVDINKDSLVLEAPLDEFIDRNKGCYPGQEVVEKVYTYSKVAPYQIRALYCESEIYPEVGSELHLGETRLGKTLSVYNAFEGEFVLFVRMHKSKYLLLNENLKIGLKSKFQKSDLFIKRFLDPNKI